MLPKFLIILLIISGVVLAQNPRQRRPVNSRILFDENDPPTFSRELDFDDETVSLAPRSNKKALNKAAKVRARISSKEEDEEEVEVKPVVQTIRRYSVENEDGTFTFGYENADGTYKEETRGSDCVVRGKYGYVDPDGVKREFAYETGNPCVPGERQEEEEELNNFRPANPQRRPVKANAPEPVAVKERRPLPPQRPTTTMRPLIEEDDGETLFVPNRAPVAPNRSRTRPMLDEEDAEPVDALNVKAKEALSALRNRKQEPAEKQQQQQRPPVVPRVNEPARNPAPRRPPIESTINFEDEFERLSNSNPVKINQNAAPDSELNRGPQRRRPSRPRQRALFIEDN